MNIFLKAITQWQLARAKGAFLVMLLLLCWSCVYLGWKATDALRTTIREHRAKRIVTSTGPDIAITNTVPEVPQLVSEFKAQQRDTRRAFFDAGVLFGAITDRTHKQTMDGTELLAAAWQRFTNRIPEAGQLQ